MRGNPFAGKGAEDAMVIDDYAGDANTARSGDVGEFHQLLQFGRKTQDVQGMEKAGMFPCYPFNVCFFSIFPIGRGNYV